MKVFRLSQVTATSKISCYYDDYKELAEVLKLLVEWNPDCKYTVEVIRKEEVNEGI